MGASAYRGLDRTADWCLGCNGPAWGTLGLHQLVSLELSLAAYSATCCSEPKLKSMPGSRHGDGLCLSAFDE